MAKGKTGTKRTTTVTTTVAPAASAGDEVDLGGDEVVTETDPIAELIDATGDDGITYTVTKIGGRVGEPQGYCGKFLAGELSLDTIRSQWGGGKYKIRATQANGQYAGFKTVEIMGGIVTPTAAAPAPGVPSITELSALMAAGKGDTTQLLLAFVKSQGDMVASLLARPQAPAPTGPSFTEILTLIKEMQPKGDSGKGSVELLLQGLELGKSLASGGGETSLTDIAAQGLNLITPLIQAKAAENAAKPPEQPRRIAAPPTEGAPPAPRAASPKAPAPGTVPAEDPMIQKLTWLTRQTQALVHQASRGRDPELYAEVMLDNLPEFITEEEIFERMQDPTAVATLGTLNADVLKFPDWFEKFRLAVIELLSDDGDEADDAPPDGEDLSPGGSA